MQQSSSVFHLAGPGPVSVQGNNHNPVKSRFDRTPKYRKDPVKNNISTIFFEAGISVRRNFQIMESDLPNIFNISFIDSLHPGKGSNSGIVLVTESSPRRRKNKNAHAI